MQYPKMYGHIVVILVWAKNMLLPPNFSVWQNYIVINNHSGSQNSLFLQDYLIIIV